VSSRLYRPWRQTAKKLVRRRVCVACMSFLLMSSAMWSSKQHQGKPGTAAGEKAELQASASGGTHLDAGLVEAVPGEGGVRLTLASSSVVRDPQPRALSGVSHHLKSCGCSAQALLALGLPRGHGEPVGRRKTAG
jgi:hypothetical protein